MIEKKKLLVKRENHSCLEINNGQKYEMPAEPEMNLTNNFSVAFWMKSTDYLPSANRHIIKRYIDAGGKRVWRMFIGGGTNSLIVLLSATGTSVVFPIVSTEIIVDGKWHHITLTFSGGDVHLYQDGFLTNSAVSSVKVLANFSDVPLDCGTTVDKTQLQQLKYYNRVLSPEEIYTLYRQYPISRVGLVGEWDFNEKSGSVIYNTSQYGALLDGTTTGTREAVVW